MLDPIRTQVLVVGAGAAGVSAAISAGRNGAQVTLVEYNGFLGGISATLTWLGYHDQDYRPIIKGLPLEFAQRLQQAGAGSDFVLDPKCGSAFSFDTHLWKCMAMELARDAGVRVMLHTHVVDTIRDGDRIAGVEVEHKSGRQQILADVVIDCSGDGDVAARGGVTWEKGRTGDGLVQAPTLVFRLGGVNRQAFVDGCKDPDIHYREWLDPFPELREKMMQRIDDMSVIVCGGFAGLIEKARAAGEFNIPQTRIVGVKLHRDDEFLVVMTRVLGLDPTSVTSMSDAYERIYLQIPELVSFFRNWVPGFADSRLLEIAPMLGVRESRRIMGDYVLTGEDCQRGQQFDDVVALGGYHIDIHRPAGTWVDSHNVETYDIPMRSLIARDVEGLLMAGKCLSATHEAVASTRVIPICMAQGQAVGTAAALAATSGVSVRSLDIRLLQQRLMDQGAELRQTLGEADPEIVEKVGKLPKNEPPTTGDRDEASANALAWVQ